MKRSSFALVLGAAALCISTLAADAAPRRGPVTFYDDYGGFRGYAWCKKPGMDIVDCNYYTLAQCQASNSGFGPAFCVRNPFKPGAPAQGRQRRTF